MRTMCNKILRPVNEIANTTDIVLDDHCRLYLAICWSSGYDNWRVLSHCLTSVYFSQGFDTTMYHSTRLHSFVCLKHLFPKVF